MTLLFCNPVPQRPFDDSGHGDVNMHERHPLRQVFGMVLLLLPGCTVVENARSDFGKATHAIASATQSQPAARTAGTRVSTRNTAAPDVAKPGVAKSATTRDAGDGAPVTLVGKSEGQVRALLGSPTSEEDRAPGKTWHYRNGQCTIDVQLYPDVQTRQFATLAYEVKSDDSTDEGKRLCMAQLRSRTAN
ncbi:MAG: hypothetical protein JSR24_01615 [Proteobacteria bacterium]|nr:hypothetical protein [Pseudomonadota bacterium]